MKKCPKCKKDHDKPGKFCSRSCANTRKHSAETRAKQSKANKKHFKPLNVCVCGTIVVNRKTCSSKCLKILQSLNCTNQMKSGKASVMGRKSAETQGNRRRSANEMIFARLCGEHFNDVDTNKPMFNGWDADVIIHDLKIAVLWNGVWHHKKITKKHSVKQVQNRDRIKQKEIVKYGYVPYVIDDHGSKDEEFVVDKFNEFLASLK